MTLRHYEIFEAVARAGNFTRAAEELYITQSAVSHAVKELEQAVGTPLFDRTARQVSLTGSGRLLLEEVRPVLTSFRRLTGRLPDLERLADIRLVSSITAACFYLPELLARYKRLRPEAPVGVRVVSAAAAFSILRSGEADLALVEGTPPQGPFQSMIFGSYRLLAACAPFYPACGRRLNPAEFCAERLLLREKGSAIRDTLDSALYLTGHCALPAWCSVNSQALAAAARSGLGITVLPDLLLREDLQRGSLVQIRVQSLNLQNRMLALWRQDRYLSAPLTDLLGLIRNGAVPDSP